MGAALGAVTLLAAISMAESRNENPLMTEELLADTALCYGHDVATLKWFGEPYVLTDTECQATTNHQIFAYSSPAEGIQDSDVSFVVTPINSGTWIKGNCLITNPETQEAWVQVQFGPHDNTLGRLKDRQVDVLYLKSSDVIGTAALKACS